MGDIYQYIQSLFGHWLFYAALFLTIFTYFIRPTMEKILKKQIPRIPQKILWIIAGLCFIVASYQAWLKEHSISVIVEKKVGALKSEIKEKDKRIEYLKDKTYQTEHRQAIEYYLVSKDGTLKSNGIDKYGLFVKKEEEHEIIGGKKYIFPKYILRFRKSPSRIEVTTQEGAIPTVKRINADVFEVIFHSSGGGWGGSPIVECNFKIQVY